MVNVHLTVAGWQEWRQLSLAEAGMTAQLHGLVSVHMAITDRQRANAIRHLVAALARSMQSLTTAQMQLMQDWRPDQTLCLEDNGTRRGGIEFAPPRSWQQPSQPFASPAVLAAPHVLWPLTLPPWLEASETSLLETGAQQPATIQQPCRLIFSSTDSPTCYKSEHVVSILSFQPGLGPCKP